ncbi:hypothetical protein [Vannielia sp.]|uniref:hypothetical protein n=1 Tax=Vannielia sp. TaxID=2813045 RepID=UPI00262A3151|nr:hypothetical protein [Vannielia sp.]MDF1872001.1 hypothetical protein [Vannielia sp.]
MDMKEHEQAIARLMEQIKAAPEHDGIDYHFLALAGLEVAELALAAMRDDLWPVDHAAAILGDAMAEAAHTGPERWIGRIEGPARALAQAGRNGQRDCEWDDVEQDGWTEAAPAPAQRVLH